MTHSEKALSAVRDLYLVQQEIKAATEQIGDALYHCSNRAFSDQFAMNAFEDMCNKATAEEAHLSLAYQTEKAGYDNDIYFPAERQSTDGEITDLLSEGGDLECPHCLKAHQLVLHRKLLKKKRGTIRRKITMLGRAAAKGGAA